MEKQILLVTAPGPGGSGRHGNKCPDDASFPSLPPNRTSEALGQVFSGIGAADLDPFPQASLPSVSSTSVLPRAQLCGFVEKRGVSARYAVAGYLSLSEDLARSEGTCTIVRVFQITATLVQAHPREHATVAMGLVKRKHDGILKASRVILYYSRADFPRVLDLLNMFPRQLQPGRHLSAESGRQARNSTAAALCCGADMNTCCIKHPKP
ncbi:hypothetical protein V8C35DRAFT_56080 [Trichoderma chlorosporum]